MIYFDNAATTRIKPEEVYQAYNYYIREIGVSPGRGSYSLGIQASRMLYQARKMVAHFFGASKSANVVFTKNSTEAINLYLNGLLKKGDHVLITPYEHNAVFRPINLLKQKGTIDYDVVRYFKKYYQNRRTAGLFVEVSDSAFSKDEIDEDSAKKTIMTYPYDRFHKKGFLDFFAGKIVFNAAIWSKLTEQDKAIIFENCEQKLTQYYKRVEKQ